MHANKNDMQVSKPQCENIEKDFEYDTIRTT